MEGGVLQFEMVKGKTSVNETVALTPTKAQTEPSREGKYLFFLGAHSFSFTLQLQSAIFYSP